MDLEIQKFIAHVTRWHAHQTGQLQSIIDAPADTPIHLGTGDDAIVLTGDHAKGFVVGIRIALSLMGTLPFHIEAAEGELPASLKDVPGLQIIDPATNLPKQ